MIVFKVIVVILVSSTFGSLFGRFHYALDLLSHFKLHLAAILALSIFAFLYLGQSSWAMLSFVGACVNFVAIAPWYFQNENQTSFSGESVGILMSNVGMNRGDLRKLADLIQMEQPEIVGLIEVTPQILSILDMGTDQYKYQLKFPTASSNQGLALYSKLPFSNGKIVKFGATASPTLVANIVIGEDSIEFILTHPYWPLGKDRSVRRNSQLQQMSEYLGASDGTVLLMGDLNTTMWSSHYREFETVSGLTNARRGYGVGPTWPSSSIFGIPIDHIMLSPPSKIDNFRVHKSIGSDHLPISARITIVPRNSIQQLGRSKSN